MSGEFELIRRHAPAGARRADVLLGSGDDAALMQPAPGKALVATVDTLVAGRHFPLLTSAYDIGWKALAVNLSDLAAMGAEAAWATVALTLPAELNEDAGTWMGEFSAGIQALAETHEVAIVGGDLTSGPLSVTIQAMGQVEAGRAMRRDGARPGDLIAVTGTLGDAAQALAMLKQGANDIPAAMLERLNRPRPRLAEGLALAGAAHAAIDISDGLAADLGHILAASKLGADIHLASLPLSPEFEALCPVPQRAARVLSGGDDYELCVCIGLEQLQALNLPLSVIGEISDQPGLRVFDASGEPLTLQATGYDHFSSD